MTSHPPDAILYRANVNDLTEGNGGGSRLASDTDMQVALPEYGADDFGHVSARIYADISRCCTARLGNRTEALAQRSLQYCKQIQT